MSLSAGCPRCSAPIAEWSDGSDHGWSCPEHGAVLPLWRPAEASYDAFVEHLQTAAAFPTYLPWPMSPGWGVTDFAVVADRPDRARATMTCCSGTSDLDGPVDVLVVTEEAGTGLGARCAGTRHDDPGVGEGPPAVRVRVESLQVSLWPVSTSGQTGEWDRSVVVGEAHGRWLWIVLRPASAMLLLRDEWILRDVSRLGPPLVETTFGGPRPPW
ncbi:DUF6758 family protein [Nocardioides sp.]|jgi:hypothetical protein|uniref:DUF6758 family protein n=1 Tax=Nocardioides sp. TaxID=35761 RepID=UPI0031FE80A6|nr:hypothetical protein [Nocardioides sp.]MCW2794783.1 hypothetical protein [Nocardioides sp.]